MAAASLVAPEVDAEAATLPPEQWRDGYWGVAEYIVEASEVGIYDRLEVLATMVTRYTNDQSLGPTSRCVTRSSQLRWRPWGGSGRAREADL